MSEVSEQIKATLAEMKELSKSLKVIVDENTELKKQVQAMGQQSMFGQNMVNAFMRAMREAGFHDGQWHRMRLVVDFQGQMLNENTINLGQVNITPADGGIVKPASGIIIPK